MGRSFSLDLWLAVWMAERPPFHLKIGESVLLNERNDFMVADLDFNGLISRFVVGKPNPKTLMKCIFFLKKNCRTCRYELNR